MKWVTYDAGDGPRAGILQDDTVRGLRAGVSLVSLLDGSLTEAGEAARRAPDEVRAIDEVRLLPPVPQPPSVRDSLCFLDHLRNCNKVLGRSETLDPLWSEIPAFYFTNPNLIYGPHDDVPIAPGSTMFDLELELGAVIGHGGRDLDPRSADKHIIGYTLFNDWSARDHQIKDLALGLGMAKSKDCGITLGPALVTTDEVMEHRTGGDISLQLSATVNDQPLASGDVRQMDWTFGELLAFISRGVDLRPGDIIGSGTVPGGCLLEHVDTGDISTFTGWLQPGDVVCLAGEGLGQTRQTIVPGPGVAALRSAIPEYISDSPTT